jgi:hypothetical protein
MMLIMMTQFTKVYPWLVILYLVFAAGSIPSYTSPLSNDYLHPNSFGINAAISSIVTFAASTIVTSGSIKLQEYWTMNKIYYMYGFIFIFVGFLLAFTLHEF